MERYVDLHTHTTFSDGSMTPAELVKHAKEQGLSGVAVTDHDTVDGLGEAVEAGSRVGIDVIPGLEISVDYKPEMHILGYFPGHTYEKIKVTLDTLKAGREKRNKKMIAKLNELGFDVSLEEALSIAGDGTLGRPHVARLLMEKGYVKSISEAFEKYLRSGAPAYFKREELNPEEGIKEIRKAGGIPVLAHPLFLDLSYHDIDELLERLVKVGLGGVEAYYVDHTADDTGNLLRLAIKHNLLVTGGSDFHGSYKPDIRIGIGHGNLKVPYELLEKLKKAQNSQIIVY